MNRDSSLEGDGVGQRVTIEVSRFEYVEGTIVAVYPQYQLVDTDDGRKSLLCGFDNRPIKLKSPATSTGEQT